MKIVNRTAMIFAIVGFLITFAFSIGMFQEQRVWDMDAHGNSIIGTDHTVTFFHPPQWVGMGGGLPMFFAWLAFICFLWIITGVFYALGGRYVTGFGLVTLILIVSMLLAGLFANMTPKVDYSDPDVFKHYIKQ